MKNNINKDNYEEIMFGLLENEFSRDEKEAIIFEIERDPFLQFEWKQFQKCVFTEDIKPYEIEEVEFWKSLHKKEEEKPAVYRTYKLHYIISIAASLIILYLLSIMFYHKGSNGINEHEIVRNDIKMKKTKGDPQPILPIPELAGKKHQQQNSVPNKPSNTIQVKEPEPEEKLAEKPSDDVPEKIENPLTSQPEQMQPANTNKYVVKITSESISEEEFAMLPDYDVYKRTKAENEKLETFLRKRKLNLAQLLKNTSVKFKKKDNAIYMLAYGDNNSIFVWKVVNY